MNNVRKYPRTMQEAFGPYTDNILYPIPTSPKELRRRHIQDWVLYAIAVAVPFVIYFTS